MNNGDQAANFIYLLGVLVLVASALMVRRIPIRQGFKMLATWILIFLAIFIVFALRSDFAALGDRLMQSVQGTATPVQQGETLRIRQALDGHFWVDTELNGETVRFLIDSGATTTSISSDTARRAGIEPSGGFPVIVQTANGTVAVQRGRADRVEVGTIVREDLAVHISDGFGETNVLGMNFLSSLSGWGVEGDWLILRP
ncbi:retropepsin-like aspartic protease family protein [Allosphingosinicella sp.]|uniref:retropepsin-like aspartic protease family protein n=1 Tax=Allosphingosinicella sp. TaxID=2823234 RepID=UPI002FC0EF59